MSDGGALPTVWLHGSFVPAEQAVVSIFDRSFLYGDGLFETIRLYGGRPFLWDEHLARLDAGARLLGIDPPFNRAELAAALRELIQRNGANEGVVRISLSRGVGARGYSTRGANQPKMTAVIYPAAPRKPDQSLEWRLATASIRIAAHDPLASFKSANKLIQILAKREAEAAGADEALVLNTDGHVAEAATSNAFWIKGADLFTPPLNAGALSGVTRQFVTGLAAALGIKVLERLTGPDALCRSDGVFLTNCSLEIVPAASLDGCELPRNPMVRDLHAAYNNAVKTWQ
jgi:aminodeoxychorismate lyase